MDAIRVENIMRGMKVLSKETYQPQGDNDDRFEIEFNMVHTAVGLRCTPLINLERRLKRLSSFVLIAPFFFERPIRQRRCSLLATRRSTAKRVRQRVVRHKKRCSSGAMTLTKSSAWRPLGLLEIPR